jgi:Bacterial regulatory proteins, lacI family
MTGTSARVTLNDVAAASGVSRAAVSFVLRDSPGQSISTATRERVREAARSLGYVPNGLARALREGTSRIVVLTIDPALEGNYARSYIRGLDLELAAHEHVLLVRYSHDPAGRPDKHLIDAVSPRAVLRFGEPYLTGRELDDSGGGWRDGLAAHVTAQVGYLAARGHQRMALALPAGRPRCARSGSASPTRRRHSACRRWYRSRPPAHRRLKREPPRRRPRRQQRNPVPRRSQPGRQQNRDTERGRLTASAPCSPASPGCTLLADRAGGPDSRSRQPPWSLP